MTPALDVALPDDVADLRDLLRRWAADRLAPLAARIDRENRFPPELWPEMGELGLLGLTVPEEFGGTALGYLAHVVAVEEIARASASVALSYGAHSNLCVNQIALNGTAAQRARLLPDLVAGRKVGALAMSESGAGSDVVGMTLRAERQGDGYLLSGAKYWITNGPDADVVMVYAKTDPEAGSRGITAFLVERGTPGFHQGPHLEKLGMRGSSTGELVFADCRLPAEAVVGEEGQGVRVLMSGLDYERVVLSGIGLGIMQACLDEVLPYLRERHQFGRPIGSFQLMQAKVADMFTALATARAYAYEVARACDAGRVTRADAAACVLYASEQAMAQAHQAVQAFGGAGFLADSTVSRLFRDAKLMEIGAGTSEIRRMLIGRELLGV